MPLSEKRKKELEMLDNPEIQTLSSSWNPFGSFLFGDKIGNLTKRKERVVELRIKMRLEELGLNANKDFQRYYQIREEEERRFDERFKNFRK